MRNDEETISDGLKRLGYTHRKTYDSGAHAFERDGRLVGYMHAHQAAALIEREDSMQATQTQRPAPPYRPPRADLSEYDTTYLLECLAAWRALAPESAQAGEIESELRRRDDLDG